MVPFGVPGGEEREGSECLLEQKEMSGAGADWGSELGHVCWAHTTLLLCVGVLWQLPQEIRRPGGDGSLVSPGRQDPETGDLCHSGVLCPCRAWRESSAVTFGSL